MTFYKTGKIVLKILPYSAVCTYIVKRTVERWSNQNCDLSIWGGRMPESASVCGDGEIDDA